MPIRALPTALTLACAALLALALTACPSDPEGNGGDDADVVSTDATPLPDGQTCEPGEIVRCLAEGTPGALYCDDSGAATVIGECNDACVDKQCKKLGPGQICYPGSVQGCIAEGGKEAFFCNNSGTGNVQGVCKGEDGSDSQCRGGVCTACSPGARKCQGDALVVQCNADGSAYDNFSECRSERGEVCTGQFCEKLCDQNAKFKSYIGCDYWGVDLDNAFVPGGGRGFYDAQGAQYAIAVANPPDSPLAAVIEINQLEGGEVSPVPYDSQGNPLPTEPLLPGELRVYRLPRRDINGTELAPKAYQVSSSVPIIAYQFNPLENANVFSNDASLLLPSTLLGSEYFVMTREQTFDVLRGYLTIIAIMPGETNVSVQVTAPTEAGTIYAGTADEAAIPHMEAGTTKNFKMKQFDVLNIETDRPGADLTGSRVLSDKRVAVFGGSEAANAPNTARCVDIDPTTKVGVCEWDHSTTCRTLTDCVNAGFNTCCADHLEQQ
ncbi:MAG: IgGFc-binding protein, partial [Myxococcales bacterium]|nr:IgGFc-binding protein [Myxococcales bacterium]